MELAPLNSHSADSGRREMIMEHLFIGDLLRHLWRTRAGNVEVLRSQIDNAGYDVVLECGGIIRCCDPCEVLQLRLESGPKEGPDDEAIKVHDSPARRVRL